MSYFGNGRIRGNEVTNNSRQVHRPESALRLAIIYLYGTVERCINIKISQLSVSSEIEMQSQDLRGRRVSRIGKMSDICFHIVK